MLGLDDEAYGAPVGRRNPRTRAAPGGSRPDAGVRPSLVLTLCAALAAIALTAPDASHAAGGILTCEKLEQNCEAYVGHMSRALARTRSDQVGQRDADELSADRCQRHYAEAKRTGTWPAHGVTPALPCKR